MHVATVGEDGRPSARLVLLKGVEHKATVSRGHAEDDYARLEAQAAGTKRPG